MGLRTKALVLGAALASYLPVATLAAPVGVGRDLNDLFPGSNGATITSAQIVATQNNGSSGALIENFRIGSSGSALCLEYVYENSSSLNYQVQVLLEYSDQSSQLPTFTVNNGFYSGQDCGPVAVPNNPPVAVDDDFGTDYAGRNVLDNDFDEDGDPLGSLLVGQPANGNVILNSNGTFQYTPNPGFFGTDSFTYRAADGKVSGNLATVTLEVPEPPNTPPVAVDDSFGSDYAGRNVLANDSDADQDPLTAELISGPANGQLSLNADGSFTYTPDEGFFGNDSFSYRASDGTDVSEVATVSLSVPEPPPPPNTPPVAVDDNFGTDYAGRNVLANDSDADQDPLTAELISGPANGQLSLNPDGSFTYTPNEGFFGSDSFTYRASDGTDVSEPASVTLDVPSPPNSPPVASDDNFGTDYAGRNVLANDSDADQDPLTAELISGPANGQLSLNADGSFTYTPNEGFVGSDSFTYRASDGTDVSEPASVTLDVPAPPNSPPVASDDNFGTDYAGRNVLANDSDADQDPLSAELVSGPANGQLSLNPDGSFTYTPNEGFVGSDSFTYRASDGTDVSEVATVSLEVEEQEVPNTPPVATDDSFGSDYTGQNILANDSDADGDELSAQLLDGPANGQLSLSADGSFTYTPNPGFFGSDSFTYQASDGMDLSEPATVTLEVPEPENTPPTAVADDFGTDYAEQNVLANDSDAEGGELTAELVEGPANGTLELNPDGSFVYTPNEGFSGSDSFTYRASDGTNTSESVTVSLEVPEPDPVNTPPEAADDDFGTDYSERNVLANDSDAEGDELTAELVEGPANGTLELNPDGSFVYTPNEGFSGSDSFTYRASDGSDVSEPATVSLTVPEPDNPPPPPPPGNQAPTGVNDNFGTDYEGRNVLSNDTDPDGDSLTAVLVQGPANGTLELNPDGSFVYAPNEGFTGSDSFTYRPNDGSVNGSLARVTLQVGEPDADNSAPQATDDAFGEDYDGRNVLANDSDPEGDALTAVLEQGPADGDLTLNSDGSFDYTPEAGFAGEVSFRYRASDGELLSEPATVSLVVVRDETAPPVAVDDDFATAWRSGNVFGNDLNVAREGLVAVKVDDPAHGELQLNPDGSFTYTPFAGYSGADQFTYLIRDAEGQESNVATVQLEVDAEEAAENGLTGKTDADGTSVLQNASPNELRMSLRIDRICERLDPETADQEDLLQLCTNLRMQGTTAKDALAALKAITPEELAAIGKAVRVLSFARFRNIGARMARVREGSSRGLSLAGLNLNYGDSAINGDQIDRMFDETLDAMGMGASGDEMLAGSRLGLWARGDLAFGDQDETELETGFDFDAETLTLGADYRFTDNLFGGLSVSFGQTEVEFAEDSARTDTDNYAVAAYGSFYRGASYVDAILSYGWSDVTTRRNIQYVDFGGEVDRRADGETDATEYYLSVNVGHSFSFGNLRLDPLVRWFYLEGSADGFTETGAGGLNLAIDDQDFEAMSLTASGQLSYVFLPSWGVVTPYLRLEYTREFEDTADGIRYRFANDPFVGLPGEESLEISVDDPDSSYLTLGAGVAAQFAYGVSGFVSYQALSGYSGLSAEIVSVGMRWERSF